MVQFLSIIVTCVLNAVKFLRENILSCYSQKFFDMFLNDNSISKVIKLRHYFGILEENEKNVLIGIIMSLQFSLSYPRVYRVFPPRNVLGVSDYDNIHNGKHCLR